MFLRLRRRLDGRDKMGRTRGMFLRLINGKVEMLRACFKLDIYIYVCILFACLCDVLNSFSHSLLRIDYSVSK